MTVNMKIDLVRIEKRGLALGLNEFAGYISVALIGFLTGYVAAAYGLKPYPFYLGFAVSYFEVYPTRTTAREGRSTKERTAKEPGRRP